MTCACACACACTTCTCTCACTCTYHMCMCMHKMCMRMHMHMHTVAPQVKTGSWIDLACDRSVYSYFERRAFSCLCALGNASAAWADDRRALEASSRANWRFTRTRAARAFAAAFAIAMLPTLLLLGRTGWRRLRRLYREYRLRRRERAARRPRLQSVRTTAPQFADPPQPVLGQRGSWRRSAEESMAEVSVEDALYAGTEASTRAKLKENATRAKLRAARRESAGRRLRVSFAMGQAGWALWVFGLTPTIMYLLTMVRSPTNSPSPALSPAPSPTP